MFSVTLAVVMALAAAEAADTPPSTGQDTAAGVTVTTGQPAPIPAKPKKDPSKKLVCVEAPQTGSIISRRICATRAEWDERARRDQEEWERQNRSTGN